MSNDVQGVVDSFVVPSNYHTAPLGQIWRVVDDAGKVELYIQTSAKDPRWMRLGAFIEEALIGGK